LPDHLKHLDRFLEFSSLLRRNVKRFALSDLSLMCGDTPSSYAVLRDVSKDGAGSSLLVLDNTGDLWGDGFASNCPISPHSKSVNCCLTLLLGKISPF